MRLAVGLDDAAVHAGGVEGHGEVASGIERDDPAGAAEMADFADDRGSGAADGPPLVFHERGDVSGGGGADEVFAVAGAGYGAGLVAGIGARADDGESPTRPNFLLVMPPVEVPAARLPIWSSATAPTVPNFSSGEAAGV